MSDNGSDILGPFFVIFTRRKHKMWPVKEAAFLVKNSGF